MKFLILSLLSALSLVTCDRPPTGPEFEHDPNNPLHEAILNSTGHTPQVLRRVRPALEEMAGVDRSVGSYERVLAREGATCRHAGSVVRCTYKKIRRRGGGLMPAGNIHFDFDISLMPGRSGAARVRICLLTYYMDRDLDPHPTPPPGVPTCD